MSQNSHQIQSHPQNLDQNQNFHPLFDYNLDEDQIEEEKVQDQDHEEEKEIFRVPTPIFFSDDPTEEYFASLTGLNKNEQNSNLKYDYEPCSLKTIKETQNSNNFLNKTEQKKFLNFLGSNNLENNNHEPKQKKFKKNSKTTTNCDFKNNNTKNNKNKNITKTCKTKMNYSSLNNNGEFEHPLIALNTTSKNILELSNLSFFSSENELSDYSNLSDLVQLCESKKMQPTSQLVQFQEQINKKNSARLFDHKSNYENNSLFENEDHKQNSKNIFKPNSLKIEQFFSNQWDSLSSEEEQDSKQPKIKRKKKQKKSKNQKTPMTQKEIKQTQQLNSTTHPQKMYYKTQREIITNFLMNPLKLDEEMNRENPSVGVVFYHHLKNVIKTSIKNGSLVSKYQLMKGANEPLVRRGKCTKEMALWIINRKFFNEDFDNTKRKRGRRKIKQNTNNNSANTYENCNLNLNNPVKKRKKRKSRSKKMKKKIVISNRFRTKKN
ncbi:hypothetical protein M0812_10565 [Anaeramoeba flamelloides]|uniref:Uncharacterized protein n=1 Tax=Anaeramoeba flamelloides TaxID=1746091 RepID=A0AAV7ZW91_9EUKA|nr:hypothetical protein M0812_10565 [Anaeramoeba flamelloides]